MEKLTIATRGSKLALWQSEHVRDQLIAAHPGLQVELNVISTKGDRVLDVALSKIGDKGLFTAELEQSLRDGSSDIAVHSFKDLPTEMEADLAIHAVLEREDTRDLLIVRKDIAQQGVGLACLPQGAKLGTSSLRRRAQALRARPDLALDDLRGNVDTRLRKLTDKHYDAIILAAAGLLRLGWLSDDLESFSEIENADQIVGVPLAPPEWLYASCQGAIAVQGRSGDARVAEILTSIHHTPSGQACNLERTLLAEVEGGCKLPVAVSALKDAQGYTLHAAVYAPDGTHAVIDQCQVPEGTSAAGEAASRALAQKLLAAGGAEILASIKL